MENYRVKLDIYNGPMDLLLYLIRREEVDIYDIPIARITEQYLQHVELINTLDPNLAGDFLVLAAALIEIKTRMLLPHVPIEEGGEEGVEIDPRTELVRQLLEYKAFKDASHDLREAAGERAMRHHRRPATLEIDNDELDLEDVQVWDLVDAFSSLMAEIGQANALTQIIYDDTPVELHAADIMDRLARDGRLTFNRIFEGRTQRTEIVGLFMALLELVRLNRITAAQERNFGEIYIFANPDAPTDDENAVVGADGPLAAAIKASAQIDRSASPAETSAPAVPAKKPARPAATGQYVPHTPAPPAGNQDDADDDHREAEGTGV